MLFGLTLEALFFYLVLLDSIFANVVAWFFSVGFKKKYKGFWRLVPVTKAWAALYLFLVLWVGYGLYRLNLLGF